MGIPRTNDFKKDKPSKLINILLAPNIIFCVKTESIGGGYDFVILVHEMGELSLDLRFYPRIPRSQQIRIIVNWLK
jgi:hypothetical protein